MAVKHGEHANSVRSSVPASTMHEHFKQSLSKVFVARRALHTTDSEFGRLSGHVVRANRRFPEELAFHSNADNARHLPTQSFETGVEELCGNPPTAGV